jgi:hypothetical protein
LRADIEEGHQSTALCHLGNISYRLGRTASPSEIKAELARLKAGPDALETFERTQRHLADNQVDLQETPLTLGAGLKLDSNDERFAGHSAANALLAREYRSPFSLPSLASI